MKKTKLILPVSAFIMAVGMAFASVHLTKTVDDKFIHLNNQCISVPEASCEGEGTVCTYDDQIVYKEQSPSVTQCLNEWERNP